MIKSSRCIKITWSLIRLARGMSSIYNLVEKANNINVPQMVDVVNSIEYIKGVNHSKVHIFELLMDEVNRHALDVVDIYGLKCKKVYGQRSIRNLPSEIYV